MNEILLIFLLKKKFLFSKLDAGCILLLVAYFVDEYVRDRAKKKSCNGYQLCIVNQSLEQFCKARSQFLVCHDPQLSDSNEVKSRVIVAPMKRLREGFRTFFVQTGQVCRS